MHLLTVFSLFAAQRSPIQIGKQVFEKQQDLSALQQKHLHQLQNLKLHEEMQKGLNASVVNEANAYHALSETHTDTNNMIMFILLCL